MTFASAFIQIRFNFRSPLAVVFDPGKMLPFGTKGGRKTVGETKRDKLYEPRFITMRQITPLVPTAKSLLEVFNLRRR